MSSKDLENDLNNIPDSNPKEEDSSHKDEENNFSDSSVSNEIEEEVEPYDFKSLPDYACK